jgi:hypothetical protein
MDDAEGASTRGGGMLTGESRSLPMRDKGCTIILLVLAERSLAPPPRGSIPASARAYTGAA